MGSRTGRSIDHPIELNLRVADPRDRADRLAELDTEKDCRFSGRIDDDSPFARRPSTLRRFRNVDHRRDGLHAEDGRVKPSKCRRRTRKTILRPRDP